MAGSERLECSKQIISRFSAFVKLFLLGSEKVQNCTFYVGAQFIEPDDNGFDKSNPYKRK
jgi:hypothetical protein